MSSIASTSSTAAANAAANATAAAAASTPILGQNDFLTLLMAQMQNQDLPLDPTDDTAFVTQLAQFSSVEQLTNMNSTMTELLTAQAGANQTATVSLVGKSVQANNNTVTVSTSGTPVTLAGTLSGSAASVTATIVNSSGQTGDTVKSVSARKAPGPAPGTAGTRAATRSPPAATPSTSRPSTRAGTRSPPASTSTGVVTGVSSSSTARRAADCQRPDRAPLLGHRDRLGARHQLEPVAPRCNPFPHQFFNPERPRILTRRTQ